MIDKLDTIDSYLNELDELNKNKFSSFDFKEVNQHLDFALNQIVSNININPKKNVSYEEQVSLKNLLSKIEKLELKIQPKANLLNSFSKFNI